jgi:glycine cleavage system protein P-like pyridoxal-binding family
MVSEIRVAQSQKVPNDNPHRYEQLKEHLKSDKSRLHQNHVQSQRQVEAPHNGSLGSKKKRTLSWLAWPKLRALIGHKSSVCMAVVAVSAKSSKTGIKYNSRTRLVTSNYAISRWAKRYPNVYEVSLENYVNEVAHACVLH